MSESKRHRTLYLVANSHLDTQWRWTIQDTIRDYLPRTLRECFAAFEAYPSFQLNFEGAFRYMLIREYYPKEFERLREWVREGRWNPAGAMLDMADVNVASPESLIRQILYAQRFFRRELGRSCNDLMLPDCFGFNHALPSVAAHCGLIGFSAQKFIRWGAPAEYPFDIGLWEGPDGASVIAAIHPEGYGEGLEAGIDRAPRWIDRLDAMERRTGLSLGYKYFGVRGDRGGAPDAESLANLEAAVAGDGPIRAVSARSDDLYRSISDADRARLPRHAGDLLLPTHGTGCLTSQAVMKRWNRDNELLADAAERAAAAADWLGGARYPGRRLRQAWIRFLWHQMHDDITGTSIPEAYRFSWNDQVVALNQFSDVLTDSVGAVARGLDTRVDGTAMVIFNPLSVQRQDIVEATVEPPRGDLTREVKVFDGEGTEVPSQTVLLDDGKIGLVFLAEVPATGFAVFDLRFATAPESAIAVDEELSVSEDHLESRFLRAEIDAEGNLASLFDKVNGREVLRAPAALQLLRDRSARWPAWEILYSDISAPPSASAGPPATRRVVECGPARVGVEIERRIAGSRIVQRLTLAAGSAGRRLEIRYLIDWKTRGRLLKAAFPLSVSDPEATYDLGLGTVRRGNNRPASHEVPAQEWVDLTATNDSFGVSLLSDARYGWDKPDDATLRLSLLRSPRTVRRFRHQATQDFGSHRLGYAIYPHAGDWRRADTVHQAARFNQPLRAFLTDSHPGPLGRKWSFFTVDDASVSVRALKRREDHDGLVVRLQESRGRRASSVSVTWAGEVREAEPLLGTEESGGAASDDVRRSIDFTPYQVRTLGVRLAPPSDTLSPPGCTPLKLAFDRAVVSRQGETGCDGFDRRGHSLPAELLPARITSAGVEFELGPRSTREANAVSCLGQEIELPATDHTEIYLLAASANGDRSADFTLGDDVQHLLVQEYSGFVGQWRQRFRTWSGWTRPGYIKRTPIAWLGTHRHDRRGRDEPYLFCYLYRHRLRIPDGCRSLRLPDDPRVLILALTLASGGNGGTIPLGPLYQ